MSYTTLPVSISDTHTHAPTRWPLLGGGLLLSAGTIVTTIFAGKTLALDSSDSTGWYQVGLAVAEAVAAGVCFIGWKMLAPVTFQADISADQIPDAAARVGMVVMKTDVLTGALAHVQQCLEKLQRQEAPEAGAAAAPRFEELEAYDSWGEITRIIGGLQTAQARIQDEEPQDQTALLTDALTTALDVLTRQNTGASGSLVPPAYLNAFQAIELGSSALNQLWMELGNQVAKAAAITRGARAAGALETRTAEDSAQDLRRQLAELEREKTALTRELETKGDAETQLGTQIAALEEQTAALTSELGTKGEAETQLGRQIAAVEEQKAAVEAKLAAAEAKIQAFVAVLRECQGVVAPLCASLVELCDVDAEAGEITFSPVAEEISAPFREFATTLRRLKWAVETLKGKWEGRIAFADLESKYLEPIHAQLLAIADKAQGDLKDTTRFFDHSLEAESPHAPMGDVWTKLDGDISRVRRYLLIASRRLLDDSIDVSSDDEGDPELISTPKKAARELKALRRGGGAAAPNRVPMGDLATISTSDDEGDE